MKGKDKFEYGGLWIHATPKYAEKWRVKGEYLYRFVEVFRCPKCGLEVVIDWSDIGYEMLEEEEKLMG